MRLIFAAASIFAVSMAAAGGPAPAAEAWKADPNELLTAADCAKPHERVDKLRLWTGRGGVCSRPVVISAPLAARAAVSELTGPGKIPAACVRVRYAALSTLGRGYQKPAVFMELGDELPAKPGPAQPVWVTVSVPKDAAPGVYKGTLSTGGASVPVELEVYAWTVPAPAEFRSFTGIYQSPDSLALQYNVPMWSEEHWKLVDRSFELMGYVGNNLLVVPLVNRTEFGNDDGLVPWVKKNGGAYDYDFTVFDRLVELAAKRCRLRTVSLQVYPGGGWFSVDPAKRSVAVPVAEKPGGACQALELPAFGTDAGRKAWKPFMAAVHEHLKKHGLENSIALGIGHCGGIHKDVVADFKELLPGARWHIAKHNRPRPNEVATNSLVEWMYIPDKLELPGRYQRFPDGEKGLACLMMQRIYDNAQPPVSLRTAHERAWLLGDGGVGRICLDYWPVKGSSTHGGRVSLYDRWPNARAGQRCPHLTYLANPGPKGALSTVRIEALREGLQELEARRFLEEALAANRLAGDLAGKVRKLIDERNKLCQQTHDMRKGADLIPAEWARLSEETYRLASQAAGAR